MRVREDGGGDVVVVLGDVVICRSWGRFVGRKKKRRERGEGVEFAGGCGEFWIVLRLLWLTEAGAPRDSSVVVEHCLRMTDLVAAALRLFGVKLARAMDLPAMMDKGREREKMRRKRGEAAVSLGGFAGAPVVEAILLLSGFQSSTEYNTTNLDHDMSKGKEAQGTPKAKQLHKGTNVDYETTKMDTCVTSKEMHTFSVLNDTSTIWDINQDNKSGAYDDVAHFQYNKSANQDTTFKRENVGGASANGTIDRKMYLAKTDDNNFEKISDEKEEDELRRRVEDFIEKINRGWRVEKLGICYQR
ncbi:hypothetical protein K7X08_035897 [Anisodus acutangulus]|uniref:Uncharacterized protein n=1 Tax=Anisodus acutangulus TaxID=402998 RepID=A0A9Q1QXJ3_9SOLA|nr:hypothetical protein K7X08_035897 [Anisodus acutangulus]